MQAKGTEETQDPRREDQPPGWNIDRGVECSSVDDRGDCINVTYGKPPLPYVYYVMFTPSNICCISSKIINTSHRDSSSSKPPPLSPLLWGVYMRSLLL